MYTTDSAKKNLIIFLEYIQKTKTLKMDNQKYVLESFNQFLKYRDSALNEKKGEGTPLDLAGAEELVKLIMKDNALLAEKRYEDSKGTKGDFLRGAVKAMKEEKYALGGVYSIAGTILTRGISETDFKILKALDPSVKDEDLKTINDSKVRKSKAQEMLKTLESLSEEDAKKRAEEAVKLIPASAEYLASGVKTPFIWGGLLSEEDRKKTYSGFLSEAQKKGYDTVEGLKKVIADEFKDQSKDDSVKMNSPGLTAFMNKKESTSVEKPKEATPKVYKTAIVKEDKQSEVFKPNMFGANGEADYMEGTFGEMLDNLGAIFQRMLTGEISTIKSITVYTSADRYRNTGPAEKLSWGQLSSLRAKSMASLVVAMAQKSGLAEEVVTKINQMIVLDFRGGNGDGTTGPNPPEPIKFGYYGEDGGKAIWKNGKSRDVMEVVEVDDDGTPKGDPKEVKKSPDPNKDDYNKYRYNNIEIEYVASELVPSPIPGKDSGIEKVIDMNYPITIRIPGRYRNKKISIPIPVIQLGIRASAGGGKSKSKTACPDFSNAGGGGKIRTSYGFGIKTVTIASWKSDITK